MLRCTIIIINGKQMRKHLTAVNILLVIILGAVVTYLNKGFRVDDALIYYRYIENFINGDGLVYNIGEKFNGLTSPLYIYISIGISSLTRETVTSQLVFNGALLTGTSIVAVLIFKKLGMENAGFIFSLILITSKYFYFVFGMETNMFIFFAMLSIYFYVNKSFLALSISGALLLMTRGEGIFLLATLMYFILKEDRNKLKYYYLIPFAAAFISLIAINYLYYNQIFPHTLTAKIAQGKSGLWGPNSFLLGAEYLKIMFNSQPFYILFLVIALMIGIIFSYRKRIIIIFCFYSFLITIFYTALNIPNYHWYYSPIFLAFYAVISFGIIKLASVIDFSSHKIRSVLIIITFMYAAITHLETVRLLRNERPNVNYTFIGEWFRYNTPPETKIAAVEIGHIGWYSKRYIIDILGLTNPFNADFVGRREFDKWFEFYKPDYIIIHDPSWAHEQSVPKLIEQGYYVEVNPFYLQGIKILKATDKLNKLKSN